MYSENGSNIDFDELQRVIAQSDVLTIGFPLVRERLLVDTRTNGDTGPLVHIVTPVTSAEQRFYELGRLRPQFGAPQQFVFFIWPHSVAHLEETGVLETIQRRCDGRVGSVATMCAEAITTLRRLEREGVRDAIAGDGFKTIWSTTAPS